ncbi:hypothetical protein ADK48_09115 [Streptomyces rimosus subsp. rimosus]|nr:hypothetical protein ADK48_09115 [Streptomyces rimosus subsp. rimosus]
MWTTHIAQDVPVAGPDAVQWLLAWYGYGPSGTRPPPTPKRGRLPLLPSAHAHPARNTEEIIDARSEPLLHALRR